MPTAVERLLDSFLKLDGIGGRREQAALDNAFLKIDADLLKLSNANADNFLKIEHDRSLKLEFDVIGEAFLKLGSDFNRGATAARLVDQFVLKLSGSPTVGSVDGAPSPQADFLFLDHKLEASATDLKILGADFLKLDTSRTVEAFQHKVTGIGNDFLKLGADMAADRDAFLKLGADFLKLGAAENPSPLDLAYKELGGEMRTVGSEFDALSTDFLKLGQAMQAAGDGSVRALDASGGGAGAIGTAFTTLFHDFLKLDTGLAALGGGAATLIGDLAHHPFPGGGEHG
jgi:hypothetical protein